MNKPVKSRKLEPPTLGDVIDIQKRIGDSDATAGQRVHVNRVTWWRWVNGIRKMSGADRELYAIKARRIERRRARRAVLGPDGS